jgi:hypothetical protein
MIDVLCVPIPTPTGTKDQDSSLALQCASVYEWMCDNFDFDVCANAVFRSAVGARCLSALGLATHHAVMRVDQYCVNIDLPAFLEARELSIGPRLTRERKFQTALQKYTDAASKPGFVPFQYYDRDMGPDRDPFGLQGTDILVGVRHRMYMADPARTDRQVPLSWILCHHRLASRVPLARRYRGGR